MAKRRQKVLRPYQWDRQPDLWTATLRGEWVLALRRLRDPASVPANGAGIVGRGRPYVRQ